MESQQYKTHQLEFQIINEISSNYFAFSISFFSLGTLDPTEIDTLNRYASSRILSVPFRSQSVLSFLNVVSIAEPKLLKEIINLFDLELVNHFRIFIKAFEIFLILFFIIELTQRTLKLEHQI